MKHKAHAGKGNHWPQGIYALYKLVSLDLPLDGLPS